MGKGWELGGAMTSNARLIRKEGEGGAGWVAVSSKAL